MWRFRGVGNGCLFFNYLHTMAIFLDTVTGAIILYQVSVVFSPPPIFFPFLFPPLFSGRRGLPCKYVLYLGVGDRACARRRRIETPSSLGGDKYCI